MSSNVGLLCHKAGSNDLAYKYGGSYLIYKGVDEGGDTPSEERTVTINVLWDPINWVCSAYHENHIMYGTISCRVTGGAATVGPSHTSNVGENMFTYTATEFPATIDVSMRFNAACSAQEYPPVTVFVAAACGKEMVQYQNLVNVPATGEGTKTVSVSVDQNGNLSIA